MTTPTPANTPSTGAQTDHIVIDIPLWLPAAGVPKQYPLSKPNSKSNSKPSSPETTSSPKKGEENT